MTTDQTYKDPWHTLSHESLWTITEALIYLSVDEDVEENQEDEGNDTVDKQVKVNEVNLDV